MFDNPVVITVGRLNDQKGQWHLIKAFKKAKNDVPNAKLVLLGEGQLKDYLMTLARELNIDKDVHFLGFQENPFKYISNSKVFVLSSLYEGFPNALAEAMACGAAILSTDCPSGPKEILAPNEYNSKNISYEINKNRYGVLVPLCDGVKHQPDSALTKEESIMADCLVHLLSDDELNQHYRKQALSRIKDFDISQIIKEWENIL